MTIFSDHVAIVTGASSGIGQAVAAKLAQQGARLVLHGRRAARLEALAAQYPNIRYVAGDICSPDAPGQLLEIGLSAFGRVDYAISNAGINHTASIEEIDVEKVCAMARTNVEAVFRFSYVMLKHFVAMNRGHLVNTTSVMGTKVRETAGAYAGTKHAIEALSEALRLEVAQTGVKVSCVAPGLVMSELHRDLEVHPSKSRNISRPLQPEDVAESILFVLQQPAHIAIPKMLILPQDHRI